LIFDRYVTPDVTRLGTAGLLAGLVVGLAWRAGGRTRWGAVPFVAAATAAAFVTQRSDWPHGHAMVAAGVGTTLLAGLGAGRLLADPAARWSWIAAGALISAVGVWAGVPETGPAVLVGAAIVGLTAAAALCRAQWSPGAGMGLAAILGWAALSGAAGFPWAALGGALCTGIAPWFAVSSLLPGYGGGRRPWPWLLGAHVALVIVAARWIGVDRQAGWARVAAVAFAGIVVSTIRRRQA